MILQEVIQAMLNHTPVWGPKPFRPLFIESVRETRYGHQAELREAQEQPGSMRLVVNVQNPTAFIQDLSV